MIFKFLFLIDYFSIFYYSKKNKKIMKKTELNILEITKLFKYRKNIKKY